MISASIVKEFKCPFSYIIRRKLFKSYLSFVLLYTFPVDTKFKFLFNSLYTFIEKENLLKSIIFPAESCWYWTDFSITLRSLLRFTLFLWCTSVHLNFLRFMFGLHWGRLERSFLNVIHDLCNFDSLIVGFYFWYLCSVFLNFQFELGDVLSLYNNQIGLFAMDFVMLVSNFLCVVAISLFWMFALPGVAFLIVPVIGRGLILRPRLLFCKDVHSS